MSETRPLPVVYYDDPSIADSLKLASVYPGDVVQIEVFNPKGAEDSIALHVSRREWPQLGGTGNRAPSPALIGMVEWPGADDSVLATSHEIRGTTRHAGTYDPAFIAGKWLKGFVEDYGYVDYGVVKTVQPIRGASARTQPLPFTMLAGETIPLDLQFIRRHGDRLKSAQTILEQLPFDGMRWHHTDGMLDAPAAGSWQFGRAHDLALQTLIYSHDGPKYKAEYQPGSNLLTAYNKETKQRVEFAHHPEEDILQVTVLAPTYLPDTENPTDDQLRACGKFSFVTSPQNQIEAVEYTPGLHEMQMLGTSIRPRIQRWPDGVIRIPGQPVLEAHITRLQQYSNDPRDVQLTPLHNRRIPDIDEVIRTFTA